MMAAASSTLDRGAIKSTRHQMILVAVAAKEIRTQDELVEHLRRKRFVVTQATVSRDIRELGLVRTHDRDGGRYIAPGRAGGEGGGPAYSAQLATIFHDHVRSVEFIDHLGVIHTHPSSASLVAAALDAGDHEEIAGTVAGDDTVIIVVRGGVAARKLHARLNKLTGNHQ